MLATFSVSWGQIIPDLNMVSHGATSPCRYILHPYPQCCALFWMNAKMTKSTEFPRDTIWAKVITLLKIRFLGRDCISSSATRPATARHNNAMLTTAFLWTCMVQCKHRNTSSLWSNMMLISYTKCLHLPSIPILFHTQDVI